MDPITATMNAIAAIFTFANSAAGQAVIMDIRALNGTIAKDFADLIHHTSATAQTQQPKV